MNAIANVGVGVHFVAFFFHFIQVLSSIFMFKKLIINILFLFFSINILSSQTVETFKSVFESANMAYESKKYDEAIEKYERILGGGFRDASVYHNVGNSYAQRGQTARARLNLERALRLIPKDAATLQSLDFVKKQIVDDIPDVSAGGLFSFFRNICEWGGARFWRIFSLAALWLGIGGLIVWLVSDARIWKKRGLLLGIGVLPLCLLCFGLAYGAFSIENNTDLAIIMQSKTALKVSSDENAVETQSLSEGIKVETKENFGGFTKIKLPNGAEGWILTANLERI
ncbi:MAG: hypothetical protein RL757_1547 [Bacteroidota bacterium]